MHIKLDEIIESNIEYKQLPLQFFLLTLWGIFFCPNDWSFRYKVVHKVLFIFVFITDFVLCVEMLIFFILSIGTDYFKLTNFFLVSACISGVYKSLKIMRNRKNLHFFLDNYFHQQWIEPQTSEEIEIYNKTNLRIRKVSIIYFISMASIVIVKDVAPIAESGLVIQLPVDAWYPYSLENPLLFWITYVQQVILGMSVVSSHVGIDALFVGLLVKSSCQIDILKHRLQDLGSFFNDENIKIESSKNLQKKIIFQYIYYHNRIFKFGEELNDMFQEMLVILVISSLPNICINTYALSSNLDRIDMDYIATFFSTTSAFIQFFIACWFGNEVSENSVSIKDAVYGMDWTKLDVSIQKILVVVMARTLKPIEFTISYIIPMNVDSFLKITKASYTAFNLLQRTSNL